VDDFPAGDVVKMFTSTNGGKKWTEATVATSHGLGGQPLAAPDGTVIVPFWADAGQIQSIVSNDGGVTFSGPYTIAAQQDHGVPFIRTEPLPTAEIDKNGKVYVAWQDCAFRNNCATNDIVMSTSKGGKTWSALTRIPIDPKSSTVDHFIPGLGVDRTTGGKNAHLALTYYYYPTDVCTFDTCRIYAGYVSSTDSGKTWTAPTQILGPIKLAWLPSAGGRFLGDYISTSIVGDLAFPVIANAKRGSGGSCVKGQITSCKEYMVAPTGGLPVVGGTIAAGPERPIPGVRSDHPPRGSHTAH